MVVDRHRHNILPPVVRRPLTHVVKEGVDRHDVHVTEMVIIQNGCWTLCAPLLH